MYLSALVAIFLPVLINGKPTYLNESSYQALLSSERLSLISFSAPGCAACDEVNSILAEAELALPNTPIGKLSCVEEPASCDNAQVFHVPTLMLSLGDGRLVKYKNGWDTSSIVHFIERQYGPKIMDMEQLSAFKTSNPASTYVVAFITRDDDASTRVYQDVAERWRGHFDFALTVDSGTADAEGVSQPSVILFNLPNGRKAVFEESFVSDKIGEFLETATKPLIEEIDPSVYDHHVEVGKPLAHILSDDLDELRNLTELLFPFADKVKDRMTFVTVNTNNYPRRGEMLGISYDSRKAFAIEDVQTTRNYPMLDTALSADSITHFASQFLDGAVPPTIRSDAVDPSSLHGPLATLVGHNFEAFALDTSRDVLVEFSIPDCHYCHGLHEQMEQLGARYAQLGVSDKVALARIDVSTNDVPLRITAYPSLRLYRARTNEVVPFVGTFHEMITQDELAAFIRDNGLYGVDASAGESVGGDPVLSLPVDVDDGVSHDEL